jgi:hypothetical protein
MSDDGKKAALEAFEAELVAARKEVTASKDAAVADIDQTRGTVVASKASFDAAVTELVQTKSSVDSTRAAVVADIEQARTAVSTAKASVDAALGEIDQAKTAIATAKGAIEAVQKTATTDSAVISGAKADVEKLKASLFVESEALSTEHAQISGKIAELKGKLKPLEELFAELVSVKAASEAERTSVASSVAEITKVREAFDALNSQAQQKHKELSSQYDALDEKIADIKGAHGDIAAFRTILFEDAEGKPSVRTGIETLTKQIQAILEETSQQRDSAKEAFLKLQKATEDEKAAMLKSISAEFATLHDALDAEIRALLPSAGAAGLSSTYYDAKSRYAWTSYAGKPGTWQATDQDRWWVRLYFWVRGTIGYNPITPFTTLFYYALFIAPVLTIVWIFYDLLHNLKPEMIATLDVKIIVLRALIALPLAAISFFGFVSLNFYRRLYEEYNHKQRVMELYASFSKEVSQSGTDDQKKQLLSVMIDTVSDRSYLAKGAVEGKDNPEVLAKVNTMSNILANLLKIKTS